MKTHHVKFSDRISFEYRTRLTSTYCGLLLDKDFIQIHSSLLRGDYNTLLGFFLEGEIGKFLERKGLTPNPAHLIDFFLIHHTNAKALGDELREFRVGTLNLLYSSYYRIENEPPKDTLPTK